MDRVLGPFATKKLAVKAELKVADAMGGLSLG